MDIENDKELMNDRETSTLEEDRELLNSRELFEFIYHEYLLL